MIIRETTSEKDKLTSERDNAIDRDNEYKEESEKMSGRNNDTLLRERQVKETMCERLATQRVRERHNTRVRKRLNEREAGVKAECGGRERMSERENE